MAAKFNISHVTWEQDVMKARVTSGTVSYDVEALVRKSADRDEARERLIGAFLQRKARDVEAWARADFLRSIAGSDISMETD